MINKTEWDRMIQGKLYNPYKVGGNTFETVHAAQKKFNESEYWNDKSAYEELKKCFKAAPDDMVLTPPVYFDHGNRISFGKHFYANTDLTILDENYVTFGDNVFLAPHISIYLSLIHISFLHGLLLYSRKRLLSSWRSARLPLNGTYRSSPMHPW